MTPHGKGLLLGLLNVSSKVPLLLDFNSTCMSSSEWADVAPVIVEAHGSAHASLYPRVHLGHTQTGNHQKVLTGACVHSKASLNPHVKHKSGVT